ncbi:MAG: glycosyltransferase family 4 protein [Methylophilaceae bacterium]|nr:glycosyltransferase family 4 protein [Methylophilaceae bacterium]
MKLAFVIFKYFPYGGAQRDMMRIARACLARGHEVHVYTQRWEAPPPDAGLALHLLPGRGWFNHARYRDFIRQVHADLHARGIDFVIGFNRMPGLDAYFAADPCFMERARQRRNPFHRLSGRFRFFAECERAVFDASSGCEILLLSPREKAFFQRWYATPDARFHLVPPPLSADRMPEIDRNAARVGVRAEFGFKPDDRLLLMVGSGFRTKGLDRAILGLAALPPQLQAHTRLLAVGQDNPRPFIRLAAKLGLAERVRICAGRDDIPRLMHAADLLVHPARSELAGHVLIEAMAAGLPVLASDVCGYAFHVAQAGAGELVASPFDQHRFNQQLEHMLTSDAYPDWRACGQRYARTLAAANDGDAEAVLLENLARRKRGNA